MSSLSNREAIENIDVDTVCDPNSLDESQINAATHFMLEFKKLSKRDRAIIEAKADITKRDPISELKRGYPEFYDRSDRTCRRKIKEIMDNFKKCVLN